MQTLQTLTQNEIECLSPELQAEFIDLLAEEQEYYLYNKIETMYLDYGPYRRDLYPRHVKFFESGGKYFERGMLGGNRSGKSTAAYTELTYHATGKYPYWWIEGHKKDPTKFKIFEHPINCWVVCVTVSVVRENCQEEHLFGKPHNIGTGLIPKDSIVKLTKSAGGHFIEEAVIRWNQKCNCTYLKSCDICKKTLSTVGFKTYDQDPETFQGVHKDLIVLDEEPLGDKGDKIYNECLARTDDSKGEAGQILCVFTPLNSGRTPVVKRFLPNILFPNNGEGGHDVDAPDKFVISVEWNNVPHLSENFKRRLLADTPDHLKDARSKGLPGMGAGSIFNIPKSHIEIDRIQIQSHWPRAFGFDPGPNKNAIVWGACDPATDVIYIYRAELYGSLHPTELAQIIKANGNGWMPGVIDNYSMANSPTDQQRLFQMYVSAGLNIQTCKKTPDADIAYITEKLRDGTLRVLSHLDQWWKGYMTYCRDENFQIIKKDDDIMDATRYLVRRFYEIARAKPEPRRHSFSANNGDVNPYTGY